MLQTTAQVLFSAKLFSSSSPPPKKPSIREREYLRTTDSGFLFGAEKASTKDFLV